MRVLVTGATGFIGGNLARMLWRRGYQVDALVRPGADTRTLEDTGIRRVAGDILDRDSVAAAVKGCEAVFHCAAAYTFWSLDPGLVHRTNVTGTKNVLDAAGDAGVPRIVYTSTVSTIGIPQPPGAHRPGGGITQPGGIRGTDGLPRTDETPSGDGISRSGDRPGGGGLPSRDASPVASGLSRAGLAVAGAMSQPGARPQSAGIPPAGPAGALGDEDTPLQPHHLVGAYKQSKFEAEQLALARAAQGLPVVVVNPTAPVGPWDVKPTPTGRMTLDFLRGRIPVYIDTGMNLVHVEDVAAGHILAMEKGVPGQRYILGNLNLSLKQIFDLLADLTGRPAPRFRAPLWLVAAAGYVDGLVEGRLLRRPPAIPLEGVRVARQPMYVSCHKAVAELGMPQTPVEEALRAAIGWFTANGYLNPKRAGVKQ